MAISGVATVYKVHPAGGGQKHSRNPRQEQSRQQDEHDAHAAPESITGSDAVDAARGDDVYDNPVGKRIDVSA